MSELQKRSNDQRECQDALQINHTSFKVHIKTYNQIFLHRNNGCANCFLPYSGGGGFPPPSPRPPTPVQSALGW